MARCGARSRAAVSAVARAAMAASQPLSSAEPGRPGAVAGLLLGVAGQDAVADGLARVERHPGEPGGDRVADVLEVRGAAADHHAEGDDGVVPLGQRLGDDRQLDRTGRADHRRLGDPAGPAASTARASSASVISACQVVATMPRVSPVASTGSTTGAPGRS